MHDETGTRVFGAVSESFANPGLVWGRETFPRDRTTRPPCRSRGSVCVASQGGLAFALRPSNHSSVDVYVDEITNKIRDDVRFGRAFVSPRDAAARIPGLRVSPQALSKSSTKVRVWHDLTFSCVTPMTGVNEDTDYSLAPTCDHGHALRDIIWRTPYMRQQLGGGARIVLRKMDVKDAFRKCRLISRAHV